jgi:hypothetical protein
MFEGLSLGNYLLVVDYSARFFRAGKARISAELAGIFERLGSRADNWQLRMEKLQKGRLFGRFLAARQERLQGVAAHLGVRRVANLAGCPARWLGLDSRINHVEHAFGRPSRLVCSMSRRQRSAIISG